MDKDLPAARKLIQNQTDDWRDMNIEKESPEERELFERMPQHPSREQLMAEVTVLTELVRVLSDRVAELEKTEPVGKFAKFTDGIWREVTDGSAGVPLYTTLPKQEQSEPVAWSYWQSCLNDDGTQTAPWVHRLSKFKPTESIINKDITPLYTTPPQRTWVGLTDEEILKFQDIVPNTLGYDLIEFAKAIEQALKERNA